MDNLYLTNISLDGYYLYLSDTYSSTSFCYLHNIFHISNTFSAYIKSFSYIIFYCMVCEKYGIRCFIDDCDIQTSIRVFKKWIEDRHPTKMRIYIG